MVHTVELVFDPDTEAAVRELWAKLAAAGLPSQPPAARPHVTLLVTARLEADADPLLEEVCRRLPLHCTIGAAILFGREAPVLARLVVPTAELLEVHAEVHRRCRPVLTDDPVRNSMPGRWTAHVTLARRIREPQLYPAVRIAARPAAITGRFVGLRRWDGDQRVEYPIGC